MYRCPRCGNINQLYIGYINNIPYCRRCIGFKKKVAPISPNLKSIIVTPKLNYELSKEQKQISSQLVDNYKKGQNTLVYAVCGAGKTEIVLQVITYALSLGRRVGFIIPRREVVKEIAKRLAEIFPTIRVNAIYGGHNQELDGDILVLTAHQAYLYANKFGLVIIDEIDAFPYYGNQTLKAFVERTCNEGFIYLSATPPKEYETNKVVTLFKRYHRYPLPEPVIIKKSELGQIIWMVKKLRQYYFDKKPCFVYLPTIKLCKRYYFFYHLFFPSCYLFHSLIENKDEIIKKFRNSEYKVLFTTTILERGITFPNLQVIVLYSDHLLFNEMNLIQIAGRVGRNYKYPSGEVYFLGKTVSEGMKIAVSKIKSANLFT